MQDITQGPTVDGKDSDLQSFFEWFGETETIPAGAQDDVRLPSSVDKSTWISLGKVVNLGGR